MKSNLVNLTFFCFHVGVFFCFGLFNILAFLFQLDVGASWVFVSSAVFSGVMLTWLIVTIKDIYKQIMVHAPMRPGRIMNETR